MDRQTSLRTVLAIALTLAVVVIWTWLFPPPTRTPAPAEAAPAAAEQVADETTQTAPGDRPAPAGGETALAPPEEAAEPAPPTGEVIAGEEGQAPLTLTVDGQEITLTARGGRVLSWKLLDYPRDPSHPDEGPVDLVSPEARALERYPLTLVADDPELTTALNESWYVVDENSPADDELAERGLAPGTRRVRFRYADGRGLEVTKTLWLGGDERYLHLAEWEVLRAGRPVPGVRLALGPGIERPATNKSRYMAEHERIVVGLVDGQQEFGVKQLRDGEVLVPEGRGVRFVAVDDRYFAIALVPREPADVRLHLAASVAAGDDDESLRRVAAEVGARRAVLFTGPKEEALLRQIDERLGTSLSGLIEWGFFGWVARPLFLLMKWLYGLIGNWGLAIIAITVLIRALFIPLTHKSMVSMRRTQEQTAKLQPKIRKIREKYRDKRDMASRQKMNEEIMALYKREGINPMASLSGCLPLLIQLPVLWAMFSLLRVVIELRGAPFVLWIRDLSAPDPTFVTPILMGVTMFAQQLMTMARTDDPQQKSQQRMMLFMPLMFTWFFLWAPSGLVIYWLTNNVLGIAQQLFVNRHAAAAESTQAARSS
ncbi:MAG: hypothetical protein Kow0062_07880 [Acidobacteriota bacterium]